LNIWIVTVGEPIPADGENVRLHRSGIMSSMLSAAGHQVHWFNSRFDHFKKENRAISGSFELGDRYTLHLLEGRSYKRNVSVSRMINHVQIATDFEKKITGMTKPDVILCSFPTIELSYSCVKFGKENKTPVLIDVRDLWPDIFVDILPSFLEWAGKLVLFNLYRQTKYALKHAEAITAVSEKYLDWGLQYANRKKHQNDKVFPLAYPMLESEWVASKEAVDTCEGLGVNPDYPIALFIGTFGRTYDLTPAILGIKLINKNSDIPVQLVLCGDGDFGEKWKSLAEADPNIIFTGWVEKPALEYMMSVSNIGLAAYVRDAPQGVPNKVIEYLARGLPILSSLKGETESLLSAENCGLTYDPSDPSQFASAVLEILNDKISDDMSKNAKKLYLKKYAAETVYLEYINLLEHYATLK